MFCRQPNTFKKQTIKEKGIYIKATRSKSVYFPFLIPGYKCPITTNDKLAANLPMEVDN